MIYPEMFYDPQEIGIVTDNGVFFWSFDRPDGVKLEQRLRTPKWVLEAWDKGHVVQVYDVILKKERRWFPVVRGKSYPDRVVQITPLKVDQFESAPWDLMKRRDIFLRARKEYESGRIVDCVLTPKEDQKLLLQTELGKRCLQVHEHSAANPEKVAILEESYETPRIVLTKGLFEARLIKVTRKVLQYSQEYMDLEGNVTLKKTIKEKVEEPFEIVDVLDYFTISSIDTNRKVVEKPIQGRGPWATLPGMPPTRFKKQVVEEEQTFHLTRKPEFDNCTHLIVPESGIIRTYKEI